MPENYYANVNTDVLRYMPPDAKLVLEVGCGAGGLGRAYKQRNPLGRYIGLELVAEVAKTARDYLDQVICADVESLDIDNILPTKEKIDCLVYGDVLVHLRDPWRILHEHASRLSERGQVIACIPNVQHWSILAGLLAGHWRYADSGLLDRTHLRFFTLESILTLFSQAGLHIHDIFPRILEHPAQNDVQAVVARAANELGVMGKTEQSLQTAAFQYVVRASKQKASPRILLHSLLGETKVCSRVRITEPHSFCATMPGVRVSENEGAIQGVPELADENKVFFWQRISPPNFQVQEELIRRGYLIIKEIDDDPHRWRETYERNDYLSFRSCHAVQVSTEPLADFIRQYNPHVAVFPNQMAEIPPMRLYTEGQPVHLFFGALNRERDWPELMPLLNEFLQGRPHHFSVVHDQSFFDALDTVHKSFIPFCPYTRYKELLMQADIALLPLSDNRFNRMKSDLKFLECAAFGAVALASPTVYAGSVRDGETGMLYRSPQEFGEKLALLFDDRIRQDIAANAYRWVRDNRMLCSHYQTRLDWYCNLRNRYSELTDEIYRRMGVKMS